jgi:hypothetical protein
MATAQMFEMPDECVRLAGLCLPGASRHALLPYLHDMNTYASAGCCTATLPTMQGRRQPILGACSDGPMLRPQHAERTAS